MFTAFMSVVHPEPHPLSMLPFATLLLTIAVAPVLLREHWHRHYAKICVGFAVITVAYYLFALREAARVLHAASDYGSFVIVVGAFFIVAAGVHLQVKGRATPAFNTLFLFAGAMLGNLFGTVGASMLLIRPWIAVNRGRFASFHLAFFIFIVSNIGGVLLPIGPPLLLGYLKGLPFWWVAQRCWLPWSVTLGLVLVTFYLFDRLNYRRPNDATPVGEKWHCSGAVNFLAMGVILTCLIALPAPWRELFIAMTAIAAYLFTSPEIRQRNEFSFAPLK